MSDSHNNGKSGPGRRKDPAKRQAILDAAKTLFLQHGYLHASMDAIAAEAGVSKLTVYSHFTDKETLFVESIRIKCEEQLPPHFFEFSRYRSVMEMLETIGVRFRKLVNSDESVALHRLMMAQTQHNPELAKLYYNAGPRVVMTAVERLLQEAANAGQLEFTSAALATDHFLSLLRNSHNVRLLCGLDEPGDDERDAEYVRSVVAVFLKAYGVEG